MAEIDQITPVRTAVVAAKSKYYASEQCQEARIVLQSMVDSDYYDTDSRLHGGSVDFVERHLRYLSTHPLTSLPGYIANLKLMTRAKRS